MVIASSLAIPDPSAVRQFTDEYVCQDDVAHKLSPTAIERVRSERPKFVPEIVTVPPDVVGAFQRLTYVMIGESYENALKPVLINPDIVIAMEFSIPEPIATRHRSEVSEFHSVCSQLETPTRIVDERSTGEKLKPSTVIVVSDEPGAFEFCEDVTTGAS
jgi:hypothetical protein